jgi:peroxiredoxin
MVSDGDEAPTFVAPLADGGIAEFDLAERLSEAPLVLAFFPGAFSGVCTGEMRTFQERLTELHAAGATLYGVSTDSPWSLNAFREDQGLTFDFVSDFDKEIIDAYGVRDDFEDIGLYGLSKRAVFVLDGDGRVTYAWVTDDASEEPDYDEVVAAARSTA